VRLCRRAVDMVLSPPVVFGNTDQRSRIIRVHPVFQPWNQLNSVVDPRFIDITGIPQRTGGAVAPQLHAARHIVAEFAALRIVVYRKNIQETFPRRSVVPAQLIEEPRQIVRSAMIVAIREEAPPVGASILLVVAAE